MKIRLHGLLAIALAMGLYVVLAAAAVSAAEGDPDEHDVVGRYSIESAAGGAVWAFQPGGELIVLGPADLMAEGTWTAVPGSSSKFDASLDVQVTGQRLKILGEVSPGRAEIALYVAASPPDDDQNALPWPEESRLTGQTLGVVSEPTPAPSPDASECLRPAWATDRLIDWEPCGTVAEPQPSASAGAAPTDAASLQP